VQGSFRPKQRVARVTLRIEVTDPAVSVDVTDIMLQPGGASRACWRTFENCRGRAGSHEDHGPRSRPRRPRRRCHRPGALWGPPTTSCPRPARASSTASPPTPPSP